jgi:hypothetical protein
MGKGDVLGAASVGALAGITAGVLTGASARIAMRMVADGVVDAVGRTPEFTVGGTLAIVFAGALVGAPLGVLYTVLARRLPGPAPVRGMLFGLACLAVIGPFFLRTEEFFSAGRIVLFALLFPLFGLVLGLVVPPSRAVASRLPLAAQGVLAFAALASAAAALIGLASAVLGSGGGLAM